MPSLLDFQFALRSIRSQPAFAFAVASSLCLGIATTTLSYTWIDSLILRPHPLVPDYDRVVALNGAAVDRAAGNAAQINYPDFQVWRENTTMFEGMAAVALVRAAVRLEGDAEGNVALGLYVTGDYFSLLRVAPALGTTFTAADEHAASSLVVVSDAFWRFRMGGDSLAVGRAIEVNGIPAKVVGVMPPHFYGHETGYAFDVWLTASMQPHVGHTLDWRGDRGVRWMSGLARLRDGVTVRGANDELAGIAMALSRAEGDRPIRTAVVIEMRNWRAGALLFPLLSTLFVITGLILVLCCVNVATLISLRTAGRQRELALRVAIGAQPSAVIRSVFTELLILGAAGGLTGLALATAAKPFLAFLIPPVGVPITVIVRTSTRVVGFAVGVSVLAMLLSGLLPALAATRMDPMSLLRSGIRDSSQRSGWFRQALVAVQITLAVSGLVLAAQFSRSLALTARVELGFRDPENILLTNLDFTAAGLSDSAARTAIPTLLERIAGLPQVSAASLSTMAPLGFGGHRFLPVEVEGYVPASEEDTAAEIVVVTPRYFETMGIDIISGRGITDSDTRGAPRAVAVNETFAARFWPNQDPIGRRLNQGSGWATVVGVIRDGIYDNIGDPPLPAVFHALDQEYRSSTILHVRAAGDPRVLIEPVRTELRAVRRDLVPLDPRTLAQQMQAATFVQRLGASTLGTFGGLAVAIAIVGLVAVMQLAISTRRREIGIRLAMGAVRHQVIRIFVARATALAGFAAIVGCTVSILVIGPVRNQLIGVDTRSPLPYLAISLIIVTVASVATFFPARNAAILDPAAVLREER